MRAVDLRVGLGDGGDEPHRRVGGERGLDLAEFDPVPADLDLLVGAAEVGQVAVGAPHHQVPGAVHALAGCAERAGDEAVGGLGGLTEVAARDADARDVQLAGNPVGQGSQPGVQHVHVRVVDRHAHHGVGALEGADTEGVDGVLGGPVEVVADGALGPGQPRPQRRSDGLAAEQHQRGPAGGVVEQSLGHELLRVGRGDVDDVDPVLPAVGDQPGGVAAQFFVADVDLVTVGEPQQFLPRHVEGEGHGVGDAEGPVAVLCQHRFEDPAPVVEQHVGESGVLGHHPLGPAGRAGGVDRVRGAPQPVGVVGRERHERLGLGQRAVQLDGTGGAP